MLLEQEDMKHTHVTSFLVLVGILNGISKGTVCPY